MGGPSILLNEGSYLQSVLAYELRFSSLHTINLDMETRLQV
jgi:hypothetical protein